jgi:hypothetical protein
MSELDNYVLPGDANEVLRKRGLQAQSLGDGINRLMSGHDNGIAYRFFLHAEKNEVKSDLAGYEVNDEVEMIEWLKSRRQKPTERVRFLPEALLKFNRHGECTAGRYQEAYLRFKSGQGHVGLPIDKWDALTVGMVKTLQSEDIYTVEQYADWPEHKVRELFSKEFVDAHKKALQYIGSSDMRTRNKEQVDKMLELEQKYAKAMDRIESLEGSKTNNGVSKRKPGRPKTKAA